MKFNEKSEEYEEEIANLLSDNNYKLVKLTIIKQKAITYKITIDQSGGVSHNDCKNVTRIIQKFLEDKGLPISCEFEVSSPGIYRELKSLRELKAFEGRRVLVRYLNQTKLLQEIGLLLDASPQKILLKTETQNEITLPSEIIKKIQLSD